MQQPESDTPDPGDEDEEEDGLWDEVASNMNPVCLSDCPSAVRLMCPTESSGHSQTDGNSKNTKFRTERRRVSESEMMSETGSKEPVMMFIS